MLFGLATGGKLLCGTQNSATFTGHEGSPPPPAPIGQTDSSRGATSQVVYLDRPGVFPTVPRSLASLTRERG